jgi:hypothetical protein
MKTFQRIIRQSHFLFPTQVIISDRMLHKSFITMSIHDVASSTESHFVWSDKPSTERLPQFNTQQHNFIPLFNDFYNHFHFIHQALYDINKQNNRPPTTPSRLTTPLHQNAQSVNKSFQRYADSVQPNKPRTDELSSFLLGAS